MAPVSTPNPDREFAGLCARFTEVRKHLGLTQEEFADAIGCSRSHVADIETFRTDPSLRAFTGVARMDLVLGPKARPIDLRWLLFGDGEMFGPRRRGVWDDSQQSTGISPDVVAGVAKHR